MTNISDAKDALDRETTRLADIGVLRMPGQTGYVVIEADYAGMANFAFVLMEMLEKWTPGNHCHLEYIDPANNPPLVIMMK